MKRPKLKLTAFILSILICLTTFSWAPYEVSAENPPLRLWWQEREHLNPLNTFDLSGSAVMRLCYRGLFEIDEQARLRCDMAESAAWSADHLTLSIKLRKDISFHDRSPLTARDAALSILCYRANLMKFHNYQLVPEPESMLSESTAGVEPPPVQTTQEEETEGSEEPERFPAAERVAHYNSLEGDPDGLHALLAIDHIVITGDHSLDIVLSEHSERLPWYLCLPVIPALYVKEMVFQAIPGTGPFRMVVNGESKEVEVVSAFKADHIKTRLQLLPLKDETAAITAFEKGRLDLLLLGYENFEDMSLRRSFNRVSQETLHYRFFLAGSRPEFALADNAVRQKFRAFFAVWPDGSPITRDIPLPLHKEDWRRRDLPELESAKTDEGPLNALKQALNGRELRIGAPAKPQSRMLVQSFCERLAVLECPLTIDWLTDEQYASYAAGGAYDFLLAEADLALPTDSRTLARETAKLCPEAAFSMPDLTADGLIPPSTSYAWDLDINALSASALRGSALALNVTMKNSPIFEIGFAKQGILFSRSVKGSISSAFENPYKGIEVLSRWD